MNYAKVNTRMPIVYLLFVGLEGSQTEELDPKVDLEGSQTEESDTRERLDSNTCFRLSGEIQAATFRLFLPYVLMNIGFPRSILNFEVKK